MGQSLLTRLFLFLLNDFSVECHACSTGFQVLFMSCYLEGPEATLIPYNLATFAQIQELQRDMVVTAI